jgi:hypothetical protein
MTIVTIGIDLAKNCFAVHGVGPSGKPELLRPEVRRGKLLELIANLPPCLLNSTLPSTFPVIGDPRLNEINGLRWFLC